MILPPQKLSLADKLARHEKTGKNNIEETIDFYIGACNWATHTQEIFDLYNAVEGYLNPDEYKNIHNPFNQKEGSEPLMYNAKLDNINILKGIANLLMGEFGRRVHEFSVISLHPDDDDLYNKGLDVLLKGYYGQYAANELHNVGIQLGQQVKELPPLEQYIEGYKAKFDESRVLCGQEAIDYIKYNCDLDSKYLDLYWDWIITGGFCSFKTVNQDEVVFEVVPRHELYFPLEKHSRFIEDYSFHVRRQVLPMFKIVDFFRGRAPEELIDALEQEITTGLSLQYDDVQMTGRNGLIRLPTLYNSSSRSSNFNSVMSGTNGIELFHVVYTSFRGYQILTYLDELNVERTMEVGEDYVLNKAQGDIRLEKQWESIKMNGYRCLGFYLDCGELEINRAELNNNGVQKSPYNGTIERSITGSLQSLIKDGLPYQRKINVLHYQLEKLINKNKDKITVMPYGLIPRNKGMDTKTTMYHADATSILWIDETAPNASFAAQMIKTLDMSLGAYIKDTIGIIQYIKSEYWDSIGMNAQRYSDVGQNAGKAVTEQAIVRSAIITYELTRQFDKVIEKDYEGLLDHSKLAWIKGKKGNYVRSDSSIAWLNMNQDNAIAHSERSYNVFVRDSSIDTEAIQAMRGQGMNLVQNGADASVIGELWSNNSTSKLTKILRKMDENKKQYDQLMQENQAQAQQQLQDSKNADNEEQRKLEIYKVDKALEGVKYTADSRNNNQRDDMPPEANETTKKLAEHKIKNDSEKVDLQRQQLAQKAIADRNKNNNK
jgi:hypothetical protein